MRRELPNAQRRSSEIVTLAMVLSNALGETPAIACPLCAYRAPWPPVSPNRAWNALRNHALRAHNMASPEFSDALVAAVEAATKTKSEIAVQTIAMTAAVDGDLLHALSCPPCPDSPFCAIQVAEGRPPLCERSPRSVSLLTQLPYTIHLSPLKEHV